MDTGELARAWDRAAKTAMATACHGLKTLPLGAGFSLVYPGEDDPLDEARTSWLASFRAEIERLPQKFTPEEVTAAGEQGWRFGGRRGLTAQLKAHSAVLTWQHNAEWFAVGHIVS